MRYAGCKRLKKLKKIADVGESGFVFEKNEYEIDSLVE